MFTRPCLLASWNIYALLQPHTVKNSQNATIFAVYFKLTINVINPICKQECWGCISHSGADFNLRLFSTQTHLFMVGSWKESTTVCQDILYFSEPSISEIRSVKTKPHNKLSKLGQRTQRADLHQTTDEEQSFSVVRWIPLNFCCLCSDSLIHLLSNGVVLLNSCLSESHSYLQVLFSRVSLIATFASLIFQALILLIPSKTKC